MYSYADHFLSPTASITVDRDEHGDVMIIAKDGGFKVVWYGTYAEAQEFVGQFDTLDYHYCWSFPSVTVFDKLNATNLTDLKFTLEMM